MQERHRVFWQAANDALTRYELIENARLDDSGVIGDIGFEGYRTIKFRAGGERPEYLVSVCPARPDSEALVRISSHHAWLDALARDTDLTVQQPVRNLDGDTIKTVDGEHGKTYLVTVLRWVEGELVLGDDGEKAPVGFPPSAMSDVGAVLGKLHRHSIAWDRPDDFDRPESESERIDRNLWRLKEAARTGRIPESSVEVLDRAIQLYRMELSVAKSSDTWGLIHGDFKCGNCVRQGDRISPIDLDWCCFGYYLADIGWSFVIHDMPRALREAHLDGYSQQMPLPKNALRLIEGTFIEGWTRLEAWCSMSESHRFEGLPNFVDAACRPYLEGAPFVLDWVDRK